MVVVQHRRSDHSTSKKVGDEPTEFVVDCDDAQSLGRDAATRAVETEAARASVRVVIAQIVESALTPIAPFAFDIRFALTGDAALGRIDDAGRVARTGLTIWETVVARGTAVASLTSKTGSTFAQAGGGVAGGG